MKTTMHFSSFKKGIKILLPRNNVFFCVITMLMLVYHVNTSLNTRKNAINLKASALKKQESKESKVVLQQNENQNLVFTNDIHDPFFPKFQWNRIFKAPLRPKYLCERIIDYIPVKNKTEEIRDTPMGEIPRRKENLFKSMKHGFEDSAFVFDWLDAYLRDDIVKEFKQIYQEAKNFSDIFSVPDIYNVTNQLEIFKQMGVGDFVVISVQESPEVIDKLISNLAKVNRNLRPDIYKVGITISQLVAVIKEWRWLYNKDQVKWEKKLFDKFDFDGDGRLSPNEFILLAIIHNYRTGKLGSTQGTHLFQDVCKAKIDPIFTYADCNGDGYVSAEELWYAFKQLKRGEKNDNIYNMYKCDAYAEMIDEYRSSAVNDIILKNDKTVVGMLTLLEFKRAILLGYWNRQVSDLEIMNDEAMTMIGERWSKDGLVDLGCERIKETKCVTCADKANVMVNLK